MCNADPASQTCRPYWSAADRLFGQKGEKPMRIVSLAAAAVLSVCSWQAGAQNVGVELQAFTLENGHDLADLCGAEPGDELYAEAKQFCYGFLSGVVHFHDALADGPNASRIVCPEGKVTRQDGAAIVAAWAMANPDEASRTDPAEAVVKAALDKWGPCQP
jgi:hypothetical protein